MALRRALAQVATGRVEQLVEVARHAGTIAVSEASEYGSGARFSIERRWRNRPAAVTSRVIVAARPAAASAAVTTAPVEASSTSIASVTSFVEKCRPLRCPARPGVPSQPVGLLRDERERRRLVEAARDALRERRRAERRELGLAEVAEVGAPEHDDGERGVAGVEDDARASVAEVEEPGAALHELFLRQK